MKMRPEDILTALFKYLKENPIKYTPLPKVNITLPFIISALMVFGLFNLHNSIPLPSTEGITSFFNISVLRIKYFESGPIPFIILFACIFGFLYLIIQIHFKKSKAFKASTVIDQKIKEAADNGNYNDIFLALFTSIQKGNKIQGYYSSRIIQLFLRWNKDQDLSAVISLKNEILEIDEEDIALSLSPAKWVEWSLPLLGFLGTVIGIGGAIGGIQKGVNILFDTKILSPEVFDQFKVGFKSMALAFDTTFQGLSGLVVVGILHFLVKSKIANKLAQARNVFTNVASGWVQGSSNQPVIAAITDLNSSLKLNLIEMATKLNQPVLNAIIEQNNNLESKINNIVERANKLNEDIEKISSISSNVIRKAPTLRWLKNIMYEPKVEFEIFDVPWIASLTNKISETLKNNWEFTSLYTEPSSNRCIAGIKSNTKTLESYFFMFALEESNKNHQIIKVPLSSNVNDEIFLLENSKSILIKHGDALLKYSYSDKTDEEDMTLIAKKDGGLNKLFSAEDRVFKTKIKDEEIIIVVKAKGVGHCIECYNTSLKLIHSFQLPVNEHKFKTSQFTIDKFSDNIIAPALVGNDNKERIYLLELLIESNQKKSKTKLTLECNMDKYFDVPESCSPSRVIALPKDIILILASDGYLYYCDKKNPIPRKIMETPLTKDGNAELIPGANGWFALATEEKLFMWEAQSGGFLYPYERLKEGLEIKAINKKTLVSDLKGEFLLGFEKRLLCIWKYPQYSTT